MMMTTENRDWIINQSLKQKELTGRLTPYLMSRMTESIAYQLVRLNPDMMLDFERQPFLSQRMILEAAKQRYYRSCDVEWLKPHRFQELDLLLTLQDETFLPMEGLEEEFRLMKYGDSIQRKSDPHPNSYFVEQFKNGIIGLPSDCFRVIETCDIDGDGEYDPIEIPYELLILWGEMAGDFSQPEDQQRLIRLAETHPNILFLLNNIDKSYRLCRYLIRLLENVRFASPYHVLMLLETEEKQ